MYFSNSMVLDNDEKRVFVIIVNWGRKKDENLWRWVHSIYRSKIEKESKIQRVKERVKEAKIGINKVKDTAGVILFFTCPLSTLPCRI